MSSASLVSTIPWAWACVLAQLAGGPGPPVPLHTAAVTYRAPNTDRADNQPAQLPEIKGNES